MANTDITITGIEEVQQMLDKAPAIAVAKGFFNGLQAARRVIVPELLARTPERVDENARPEDQAPLRESVVADVTLDSRLRGGTLEIGFGKMGHVANFVEYGHRIVGHRPGKKDTGKFVPANPFMRQAAAVSADAAIQAFEDALVESLREDFGG